MPQSVAINDSEFDLLKKLVMNASVIVDAGVPPGGVVEGFPVDMLLRFGDGAPGAIVTMGNLVNDTIDNIVNWQLVYEDIGHTRYTGDSSIRRKPLKINGINYSAGTKGIVFDMTEAIDTAQGLDGFQGIFPGGVSDISVTALMKFNAIGADSGDVAIDHIRIDGGGYGVMGQGITAGEYVANNDTAGHLYAHGQIEGGGSTFGPGFPIERDKLYSITVRNHGSAGYIEVIALDATTGALIGTSRAAKLSGDITAIFFQDYLVFFGGQTYYNGMVGFAWTEPAFPMETFSVSSPTGLTVDQNEASKLDLAWSGLCFTYQIERNANGAGWTTLVASQTAKTYQDATVSDGNTYQYRITGMINEHTSVPSISDGATVDDSAFVESDFVTSFTGGFSNGSPSGTEAGFVFVVGGAPITITQLGYSVTAGTYASHTVKVCAADGTTVLASATPDFGAVAIGETTWSAITPLVIPAGSTRHFRLLVNGSFSEFQGTAGLGSFTTVGVASITDFSNAAGSNADGGSADINFRYSP